MDPQIADLIKFALGGAAAFLAKSGLDYVRAWREGKSMKEAGLVSNLSTALEREEKDHRDTISDLRHRTDERDYWRNYAGGLMFLLNKNNIPFDPPREVERRKSNERAE